MPPKNFKTRSIVITNSDDEVVKRVSRQLTMSDVRSYSAAIRFIIRQWDELTRKDVEDEQRRS